MKPLTRYAQVCGAARIFYLKKEILYGNKKNASRDGVRRDEIIKACLVIIYTEDTHGYQQQKYVNS
ncbi:hypothetical protein DRT92_20235 [Salmonella enterica subsp. enterica serovar Newport]|nr:hypothetical protein [Salmonella enterica subsp. enterica serovar Newport]EBS2390046.1 hypothetical protein [Salmonella enterica subsp. enterica serovar Newport]ECA8783235.1 hypothetical protein [Salmonella enterica subsp. enterica serovar Newport]ECA9146188.1 hypothetical protein [Salmonella enterica subsp. enterica serovar Montevideo]ECD2007322.1 hypothetical protein [Salmonella enterica subsp. enterica serovar Newport]